MDRRESYVPQEGLHLGVESVVFTDTDGTKEVLLFSRIVSVVVVDEGDNQRVLASQKG